MVTPQTGRNLLNRFASWGIVDELGQVGSGARPYYSSRLFDVIRKPAEAPTAADETQVP